MLIPLVDVLRCTQPHEETWLVASIDRAEDRDILEGTLGCPTCLAEYPIHDGVVTFESGVARPELRQPSENDVMRLAAALDLVDPRMTAVLHGSWGAYAPLIRGISPVPVILVNPPGGIASGDGISIVLCSTAPIAAAAVNAVAVDGGATDAMVASLVRSLRAGGRMVGPAGTTLPENLVEIARDDELWVARVDTTVTVSAPIPLTRRSP
jgi:uncharacterized protein YbaR (Trm112 family)